MAQVIPDICILPGAGQARRSGPTRRRTPDLSGTLDVGIYVCGFIVPGGSGAGERNE